MISSRPSTKTGANLTNIPLFVITLTINMALSPKDVYGFLPLLATADTKINFTVSMDLVHYLGDPNNSIECSSIGRFIGGLVAWMQSSNTKVGAFSHSFE
jgi:hypothetical protein